MRSYLCSLFHLSFGNENGGVQLVYESTCCLAWGVILDRRKDRGVVCVYSVFKVGGSVYSDASPGVRMRHLEGPKNPDGLNLGIYVFIHVYTAHMCMYMLGGRMRSWTTCFFL